MMVAGDLSRGAACYRQWEVAPVAWREHCGRHCSFVVWLQRFYVCGLCLGRPDLQVWEHHLVRNHAEVAGRSAP